MASTLWPVKFFIASGIAVLFLVVGFLSISTISYSDKMEGTPLDVSEFGYPLGQIDKVEASKLGPNVMVLRQFAWSGLIEGEDVKGAPIIPVLVIKDPKQIPRICDYSPNMTVIIKRTLERTLFRSGKASHEALYEAGQTAMEKINSQLGKVWLKDMYLLHDVDMSLLTAAGGCRLISSET